MFPVVSSIILLYAIYRGSSTPSQPTRSTLHRSSSVAWFILGVIVLLVLRARGDEEWMIKAGQSIGDELARPGVRHRRVPGHGRLVGQPR